MKSLLLALLLAFPVLVLAQDCTVARYRQLLREADQAAFGKMPDYQLAVNKLLSAQTCQPDSQAVVNAQLVRVFEEVNRQRELAVKNEREAKRQQALAVKNEKEAKKQTERAEAEARRIYANDMAYKSELALKNGDRTTAYRLAEFAHRYVDRDNEQVTQALFNALYYNDNPEHTPLPWASNLEGHTGVVLCVAFSPDGTLLATGSLDNTAKIWNLQSGKNTLTLTGHNSFVNSVAFSSDGSLLATGSADKTSKIWNLQSGENTLTLEEHSDFVTSVAFSPDGFLLATGSNDQTVKIWNLQSGESIRTFDGHNDGVSSVAFSPDGALLATGSSDQTVKIWSLQSGKNILTLEGHNSSVSSVAFSPDGALLATGSYDHTAKIWNLQSGKATQIFAGHNDWINTVAFSPDGTLLATASSDKTTKIWNLQSGKDTLTLQGYLEPVLGVAFSPDGSLLATGSDDNTAKIWNLQSREKALTLEAHKSLITSIVFSPDGTLLATGSYDNTAKIWDLQSGKNTLTLEGHNSLITNVAFSPDGTLLATGSNDNTAKIWDLQSGKNTLTLEGYNDAISSVAFSPDGSLLATGSYDNTAKVWNLQSGQITLVLKGHNAPVSSVAFSPDGALLATGSQDQTAKTWNLLSGKNVLTFEGHTAAVFSVAFSPDGRLLATGSDDRTAKIWNLQSQKNTLTLEGHNSWVRGVAFLPNGSLIATGSNDRTARIWSLQSGKNILTLEGQSLYNNNVTFSPDGSLLATGSNDLTVKFWKVTADGCLGVALSQPYLAGLTLSQINSYGLENLLDQQPGNEAQLVASRNVWQMAAFAERYSQNTRNSKILEHTNPYYIRAARLYRAAAEVTRDSVFWARLGALYSDWASDILESARPDTARWYVEQACLLNPDNATCPELWQRLSVKTGQPFDSQQFLKSENVAELRGYGDFFFQKEQWAQAQQLYEKAETKQHQATVLQHLFLIAEKIGQSFDFQRFLNSERATELRDYGNFFFQKKQWTEAQQLYEKAESKQHKAVVLQHLFTIAEQTGQPFDYQPFLKEESITELKQYAESLTVRAEKLETPKDRVPDYQRAAQLLEQQMRFDTTAALRITSANVYNSLAFYQLFAADGKGAEASLQRAKELNPNNPFIPTNRAPALLLQGLETAAKAEYQKWKDQPFNQLGFPTYRDAFLTDLKDLEAAGVPINYSQVRQWLEE